MHILTSIFKAGEPGLDSDFRLGSVLFGEKNEIVSGTTLKFFVGNGIVMLRIVLSDTWVIFPDDHFRAFLHIRLE